VTEGNGPEKSGSDEDVLDLARKRFQSAEEAEREIRTLGLEDLKFSVGEQWPDDLRRKRELEKRPCLTINRLSHSIRQVVNEQLKNPISSKVSPVDDKADIETAKIYNGMLRHIQYASDASTAYGTAFNFAARASFGYFRLLTEYCDPFSFDQEIRIARIRNPFTVYLDPNYQQPDGSDANWGFIFEDISKEEYDEKYPDSKLASMDDWLSIGDSRSEWITKDTIRVAEYFSKETKEITIVQLADGQVVDKALLQGDEQIINERKSYVSVIKWRLINGVEVLEEKILPGSGKWIPIIPVLGEEICFEGKRILEGVVRHAKDSQRMYNYWATAETETIALAPKAPFIGVEGQFEGHESKWRSANTENYPYLEYKAKTIGGQIAPPPQRNVIEPPVMAITQARMQASEDLKATTGIYDAALGARSNETSGVAIKNRAVQAQTSNYHLVDNLSKSVRHCGRISIDWMPYVYDGARAVRILGEDGAEEIIRINQEFERKGEIVNYDLSRGKYDVTVSVGPSYESKRQEAVDAMLEFTRSMPGQAAVIADLLVKNMDWPGAQEFAERLRKTLPPEFQSDGEKKSIPPEIKSQFDQMGQMIEALTGQLNEANGKIENKTIELESRERIEMAKIQANIELELAKMGSQEGMFLLKQEVAEIQGRLDLLNFNQPVGDEGQELPAQPSGQGEQFEQDLNGAGPEMGLAPDQLQPTGGIPPGEPME
jgi:hypothetical protein